MLTWFKQIVVITGISDAVAETIIELEIDWSGIETLGNLQTGLQTVMTGIDRHNDW